MPDPTVDAPGSYWVDGAGGGTALSAADLNAREVLLSSFIQTFTQSGTLAAGAGTTAFRLPFDAILVSVTATVGTAPTGTSVIADVNRNGVTIFTTQANRPTVPAGQFTSAAATADVTLLLAGDRITVDIDQVGSTIPGSDLTVTLDLQKTTHSIAALPSPIGWWKAADLALADGTAVSSWTDASGNSRTLTQATGANQPVLKTAITPAGGKVVRFDGANDVLKTAAFANPTTGTCAVVVYRFSAVASAFQEVFTHAAQATWVSPWANIALRLDTSNVWQGWVTLGTALFVGGAPAEVAGRWGVVALNYDQANVGIYKNGTLINQSGQSAAIAAATQPVVVGANTDAGDPFAGDIAEVRYYGQGLTTLQLAKLANDLMATHGL